MAQWPFGEEVLESRCCRSWANALVRRGEACCEPPFDGSVANDCNESRRLTGPPSGRGGTLTYHRIGVSCASQQCPVMEWSGRAPAPSVSKAGKGRRRRGARHVPETRHYHRRGRHRYRQELVSRRGSRSTWRDRVAAEVVASPS